MSALRTAEFLDGISRISSFAGWSRGRTPRLFATIRLELLKKSPDSFGSDFASENGRPPEWFAERLTTSDVFGAFHGEELLGIAGIPGGAEGEAGA